MVRQFLHFHFICRPLTQHPYIPGQPPVGLAVSCLMTIPRLASFPSPQTHIQLADQPVLCLEVVKVPMAPRLPLCNSTVEPIVDRNADRETLAGEQPYSVTSWANRNPGVPTIPLRPSRQISEAQKASRAISREQRAEKAALLDSAVQEYLVRQASEIEAIALKHNVTIKYVKGLIGGETHYHSTRKAQRHNALLRVKALEVNASRSSYLIDLFFI